MRWTLISSSLTLLLFTWYVTNASQNQHEANVGVGMLLILVCLPSSLLVLTVVTTIDVFGFFQGAIALDVLVTFLSCALSIALNWMVFRASTVRKLVAKLDQFFAYQKSRTAVVPGDTGARQKVEKAHIKAKEDRDQ